MSQKQSASPGMKSEAARSLKSWVLLLGVILAGSYYPADATAQNGPVTARLEMTLPHFTVRQATLGHAMTQLQLQGVPVCYEQLNVRDDATGRVSRPGVNIDLSDVAVSEALNRVTALAGGYRWETDTPHGVINVLPVDSYAEKVHLSVSAREKGLLDLVWSKELDLEAYGIYMLHDGPWVPNPAVTLDLSNASLKDVLNALVGQAPGWAWQLVGVEGRRSLTFSYWGSE